MRLALGERLHNPSSSLIFNLFSNRSETVHVQMPSEASTGILHFGLDYLDQVASAIPSCIDRMVGFKSSFSLVP